MFQTYTRRYQSPCAVCCDFATSYRPPSPYGEFDRRLFESRLSLASTVQEAPTPTPPKLAIHAHNVKYIPELPCTTCKSPTLQGCTSASPSVGLHPPRSRPGPSRPLAACSCAGTSMTRASRPGSLTHSAYERYPCASATSRWPPARVGARARAASAALHTRREDPSRDSSCMIASQVGLMVGRLSTLPSPLP